jgi:hypothetical protein
LQWEIPHDAAGKVPRGEKAPGTLKYDQKYLNEKFTDFVSIMKQFMKVCVLGGPSGKAILWRLSRILCRILVDLCPPAWSALWL